MLYPPQIGSDAREFIGSFLKKDPAQRMTIRSSFSHAFIRKYNLKEKDDAPEDIKQLFV